MIFDDTHHQLRTTVRTLIAREIAPFVDTWEDRGSFDAHELFPKLAAAGLLGLEYDPAYGGQGVDHSYSVVLGEELGRIGCGGVPVAIAVQTDMATPALHQFGSDDLKRTYLVPALAGRQVAAVAVTEPDAGSDVAGIRTRAHREDGHWVINGSKLYITNGVQADWICVLARTSDDGGARGFSQIVVPTDTPGFRVSRKLDKLGLHCSDTAELTFEGVRVPVANTIGEIGRGFQQQMAQFQTERMIATYLAIGSMTRALERTREYLAQRHAFGGPLLANQHITYRLAELYAELDLLRHYAYASADARMRGEDTTYFATVAKLKAGRLWREVADACLQFHGGIGYMEEMWTARLYRDARFLSIAAGADEVMLRVIARAQGLG